MKSLTAVAVILLSSLAITLSGCSSDTVVNPPEDTAQTTMPEDLIAEGPHTTEYEEFFDLEQTYIPTDEEILAIYDRINQVRENLYAQLEKDGINGFSGLETDIYTYARESGIEPVEYKDIVNALGRPHYSEGSGLEYLVWESDTGKKLVILPSIPDFVDDYLNLNDHDQYHWACEHYGYVLWP